MGLFEEQNVLHELYLFRRHNTELSVWLEMSESIKTIWKKLLWYGSK